MIEENNFDTKQHNHCGNGAQIFDVIKKLEQIEERVLELNDKIQTINVLCYQCRVALRLICYEEKEVKKKSQKFNTCMHREYLTCHIGIEGMIERAKNIYREVIKNVRIKS